MKKVHSIHGHGNAHWVGDGFPVHTVFSYNELGRELSPFLLLDHAGPRDFEPAENPRGVDWHPHRGFETVTIVFDGEVDHEDTAGNRGSIGPGDVQWMTAGSGVLHKEFHSPGFTRRGGRFELLQLWVNLPADSKMTAPKYQPLLARDFPVVTLPHGAGTARVIAGEFRGVRGPASTFTPIHLYDLHLRAGHPVRLRLHDGYNAAFFVMKGGIAVNEKHSAHEAQLVLFERQGDDAGIAATTDANVFVMNGRPLDEPIAGYGPFVMNTEQEIRQAIEDLRAGRFGTPRS
jgi:redox-sensitive bicupin YhaK (pirin superfamily)